MTKRKRFPGFMDPFRPPKSRETDPSAIDREIAVEALGRLADDPQLLARFLALTGIAPADIRAAAADPGFLSGVLDFFAGDETALLALAAATGRDPARIATARERMAAAGR